MLICRKPGKLLNFVKRKNIAYLSIGKKGKYIELFDITRTSNGQQIAFEVLGKLYTVNTHLIGEFQAYNLLTALALIVASGANIDEAVSLLSKIDEVPGRMQGVKSLKKEEKNTQIYIDYAHTPRRIGKSP